MPRSRNFLHLYTSAYIWKRYTSLICLYCDVIQAFLINFLLIPWHIHIHHIARATKTSQVLKAWYVHVALLYIYVRIYTRFNVYLNHIARTYELHISRSNREKYYYLLIIYMLHYDDDKSETFNINITQMMDIQTCVEKKPYIERTYGPISMARYTDAIWHT